jgi:hypothetical protein
LPGPSGATSERPSSSHGTSTPSTSAIVGTTSIVRAGPSTVSPRVCPGAFTKSGTKAISSMFPGSTRRRSPLGRKLTPWSATTTTSDSS